MDDLNRKLWHNDSIWCNSILTLLNYKADRQDPRTRDILLLFANTVKASFVYQKQFCTRPHIYVSVSTR